MKIEKSIRKFLVFSGDKIIDALQRMNENQSRIIFVVQNNGLLLGSVSDGDFRRWLTQTQDFDLNQPIDQVMNPDLVFYSVNEDHETINKAFANRIDIIPLVDDLQRFVAIARKTSHELENGDFAVSENGPAFVVAEIGNNHNGDLDLAKKLIDLAIEAGADGVKFQMRDLSTLYRNNGSRADYSADLGTQYTLDLLHKFQLPPEAHYQLFDYCKQGGVLPFCTPWDLNSLVNLEAYDMDVYKVASADFTNFELLAALAKTGKPLICSTGMSTEAEIRESIRFLRGHSVQYALLHCNSTYPAPYKDLNLNYLKKLRELSGTIVGYSGHERGYAVPVAAVALGAKIVEKHFTVDRDMEGIDHKVSLLPAEFREMVAQIRQVEKSLGESIPRRLTQGEMINRENLAKSLAINCSLKKGQVICRDMVAVKSPGQGIQPNRLDALVGKKAVRDLQPEDFFSNRILCPSPPKKSITPFHDPMASLCAIMTFMP